MRSAAATGPSSHDAIPSFLIFGRKVFALYRWQSHGFSSDLICLGCTRLKTAIQGPRFVVEYSEWVPGDFSTPLVNRASHWVFSWQSHASTPHNFHATANELQSSKHGIGQR